MSNVDINVDRRTDGLTDGRTDRRKIGRLYRTLLQAGAIKSAGLNTNNRYPADTQQAHSVAMMSFQRCIPAWYLSDTSISKQ